MTFHEQSFEARLGAMGDTAEGVFDIVYPKHHKLGLNRPPFNVAGMGQKPPNYIAFYGCQKAEDLFALKGEQEWTWEGLMRAVVLTQMKLRAKGLLPL